MIMCMAARTGAAPCERSPEPTKFEAVFLFDGPLASSLLFPFPTLVELLVECAKERLKVIKKEKLSGSPLYTLLRTAAQRAKEKARSPAS